MSEIMDVTGGIHLAGTSPAFCSCCLAGAQEGIRFVDFDCDHDSGQFVHEVDGVVMQRFSGDSLFLCEACVRTAAQRLQFKPNVHAEANQQIRRLKVTVDHWRSVAQKALAQVEDLTKLKELA